MSKGSAIARNLTILSGLSVATLHILNRLETTDACSETRTSSREDKEYNWRYGTIHYKVRGYDSPVLLLHDLTIGSNKYEYNSIFATLSKTHRVYVPDFLGYGESDKHPMTYSASVYKDMLADFIKNVIKTKVKVVVTGASAPIVIDLAHANPRLIDSIVMINPLGLYDQNLIPSTETRLLKILMDIPIIGTYMYNFKAKKISLENEFKTKYIHDPDSMNSETLTRTIQEYYRSAHLGGLHAKYSYASYISQYMTCSVLNELRELDLSMMIIGGEFEPDISDNIENYVYYNAAIESTIIPGTSHLPHVEKPEEVLKTIEVFFS